VQPFAAADTLKNIGLPRLAARVIEIQHRSPWTVALTVDLPASSSGASNTMCRLGLVLALCTRAFARAAVRRARGDDECLLLGAPYRGANDCVVFRRICVVRRIVQRANVCRRLGLPERIEHMNRQCRGARHDKGVFHEIGNARVVTRAERLIGFEAVALRNGVDRRCGVVRPTP
jgi:hypothetical protein